MIFYHLSKKDFRYQIKQTSRIQLQDFTQYTTMWCKSEYVAWVNICNIDADIQHLLYNCEIANSIWRIVSKLVQRNISVIGVIISEHCEPHIVDVITFIIGFYRNIPKPREMLTLSLLLYALILTIDECMTYTGKIYT